MTAFDEHYWQERWHKGQTGWDIGGPAPAILQHFRSLDDKALSILIPGCGNAYEAKALWDMGFTRITVAEIVAAKAAELRERFSDTGIRVLHEDFFRLEGQYDIIVEHTFFCSLSPDLRPAYVQQAHRLLRENGQLTGLLFNRTFEQPGPPFGGSPEEYTALFTPVFRQVSLEPCNNSIPPRAGKELYMVLTR